MSFADASVTCVQSPRKSDGHKRLEAFSVTTARQFRRQCYKPLPMMDRTTFRNKRFMISSCCTRPRLVETLPLLRYAPASHSQTGVTGSGEHGPLPTSFICSIHELPICVCSTPRIKSCVLWCFVLNLSPLGASSQCYKRLAEHQPNQVT